MKCGTRSTFGSEAVKRERSWEESQFPATGDFWTDFLRIRPSWMEITEAVEAPTSITRAVALPAPKAAITLLRASQKAGQPQDSMATSMDFSRFLTLFQAVSVMSNGCSPSVLSPSSTSSIGTSAVFKPFVRGSDCLNVVSREVIAYSHSCVAVSQSSTMPSFDMGFRISKPLRGLWISSSPNVSLPESETP